MPFEISHDDEEARRQLRVVRAGLEDLRNFWPLVVPIFVGWMRSQFDSEGAFGGQRWQPLAPSTIAHKARYGLRPNILQATGAMKQAASRPTRQQTPTSLTLTIESAYLGYHQAGDGVPKRPLIFGDPLPASARADLDAAADRYVDGLLNSSGGRR